MTATLDYASLPPEINSARMYSGAGSGPMLAAASAWNGLAAELRATALCYDAVLSALIGDEWFGPASASMAAAAKPYLDWMSATAGQAEQTATQAESAAGAYDAAFAATVAPPVVAANRAQLAALTATNILGQNTPAIAAIEAQYLEMWAQDAAAMYGYAGSSAIAAELSPFTEPHETTNLSGLAAQANAVNQTAATAAAGQQSGLSQLISAVPGALQGLAGPNGGGGLSDVANLVLTGTGPDAWQSFLAMWGPNANFWNTVTSTGAFTPGATVGTLSSLFGASALTAGTAQDTASSAIGAAVTPLESADGLRGLVAAGVGTSGNAGHIGKLSVPPAWASSSPLTSPLPAALGGTPMVAPSPVGAAGMPGVPLGNLASQPFGRAVPQYGFRPSFVVRPPAAG